jgi:hypothetical protein
MSHLILHIGLHKTGTTSLQELCFGRARDLARHGLIYPRLTSAAHPQGVAGHHGLTLNLAQHFPQYLPPDGTDAAWDKIVAQHAGSDRSVLISSEEFSRGRQGFRVDMARLAQIAAAFDTVTVVCVLRDQLQFVQSVVAQMGRVGGVPGLDPFIRSVFRNDTGGLWTDWRALHDHLLGGFPAARLHFIDYDRAKARPGGVIGAVLGLGKITYRSRGAASRLNQSLPPLALALCLAQFPGQPVPEQAVWAVDAQIKARFGPARPTTIYTRAEAAALSAHFAAPNAELVARIRKVQPDFAFGIAPLPTATLYREDVLPAADAIMAAAGLGTMGNSARR